MTHLTSTVALALAGASLLPAAAQGASPHQLQLSRSIYVRLQFSIPPEIAEHFRVFVNDVESKQAALPYTFLFTYYPDKGSRFFPEEVRMRFESPGACDGKDYAASLRVTPGSIESNQGIRHFDIHDLEHQAKMKRDLHVAPQIILLRCPKVEMPRPPEQEPSAEGSRVRREKADSHRRGSGA